MGTPRATTRVAEVAQRLTARRHEFTAELLTLFAAEIAPLQHDDHLLGALAHSIEENVAAGLYILAHDVDPRSLGAPPAAVRYARLLAQRGIPASAMLRAYRLGHAAFVELALAELAAEPGIGTAEAAEANVAILRATTAYVDTAAEMVVGAYEEERESWAQHHSIVRAARIQALLNGADGDPTIEAALGYRLNQTHVAVLCWLDERTPGPGEGLWDLERAAGTCAKAVRAQLLFSPADEGSATVWFGSAAPAPDEAAVAEALVSAAPNGMRAALGRPGWGPVGFRGSHRQARAARQVALAAGPRAGTVTRFADVGAIALLCADLTATRAWVADTLGDLATDDDQAERLRETVRVFLNLGSSHTAAAERLNLHKNSVQYRIAKAEALRGRPLRADRADVELALRVCHVLGPAVLRRPT